MAWTYWTNCTPTCPCDCTGGSVITPPTTVDCDNCLLVSRITVPCESSTPPCGIAGTLDLTAAHDTTACTGTITYSVLSFDSDVITGVAIDASGELSWTTTADAPINTYTDVVYLIECSNSILSAQGIASICIQSLCPTAPCAEGTECNPCDGNCDPIVPDVEIS